MLSGWIPGSSNIRGNIEHFVVRASKWSRSGVDAGDVLARRGTLHVRRRGGWAFRLGSPSLQQTKHQLTQPCSPQSTAYRDPQRRSFFQNTNQYKIKQNRKYTKHKRHMILGYHLSFESSFFLFPFRLCAWNTRGNLELNFDRTIISIHFSYITTLISRTIMCCDCWKYICKKTLIDPVINIKWNDKFVFKFFRLCYTCYTSVFINVYKCANKREWHLLLISFYKSYKCKRPTRLLFMCQIVTLNLWQE